MTDEKTKTAPVHEEKRGTEYLANERTFLAWIRTSVAVMSLGFLISRFGLWLRELAAEKSGKPLSSPGSSMLIGEVMMGFGGLLALLAAWRYHVVNRDIERGRVKADRGLVVLVTAVVAVIAAAMIVSMLTAAP